jgi:hypothetical protein
MILYALVVYLLFQLAFLAWSFSFEGVASARLWFLRIMLIGMAYDNLILILGNVGVGSDWYLVANYPRFILHAAVLPFLTLFTLSALQVCEVPLARKQAFVQFCWAFTAAAWVYGVWHEVFLLELEPVETMGHMRLVSVSKIPPLATIATNILILPLAFLLWRRVGWYVFFLGALFIFLLNGSTGSRPWGFIVGNGAEVIFICCLLITERFLIRRRTDSTSEIVETKL